MDNVDNLKIVKANLMRELAIRKSKETDLSKVHSDRYRKGFIDCLDWTIKLIDFEINRIGEEK